MSLLLLHLGGQDYCVYKSAVPLSWLSQSPYTIVLDANRNPLAYIQAAPGFFTTQQYMKCLRPMDPTLVGLFMAMHKGLVRRS